MLLLSIRSHINESITSIYSLYVTLYSPEHVKLDTDLYTCTVKGEVVKFEIFKLKYPACHVIVQRFNPIGSQALGNQSKYHIRQFIPN